MDEISLYWKLIALATLLVVSAFFSIAETSMMAINRYRLNALVRSGNKGAVLTAELLSKTDKLLGVILLGNNLVNAAAATLVGVITIEFFGNDEIALGIGTLIVTLLILVFSEITPKVVGAAYAERIALPLGFVLRPLLRLMYPVVWFVNLFVSLLLFVLRIRTSGRESTQRLTMEELRSLVLDSGHFMPKKHLSILVNLFDLEAITIEDVMTPRAQIESISLDDPIEEIVKQITTSYHTRLPVFHGDQGNVAGILHLRRALGPLQSGGITLDAIHSILQEPYYVPAGTPAFSQLQYFQENRQRVALVVDEYGELQGMVTLEDIIEEIIGEFTTTAPVKSTRIRWTTTDARASALVEGSTTLRDINRKLALSLPLDGPKTLNGLILEFFQDIPETGVSIKINSVPMEIVQTQDRTVKTVRVFKPIEPSPEEF
jgi:Mg2+/Co2+ transporter CorB